MNERLNVLVTGAASGIGKATALRFANEGYNVCANDVQKEKLTTLMNELPPGDHIILPGSYADPKTIEAARKLLTEKWDAIHVLVNCAGLFEKTDPIAMSINEWRRVFDIMKNGTLKISRLAAHFMHESGRMIHITSIHGTRAEQWESIYSMEKTAINQFCRSMAVELAPK